MADKFNPIIAPKEKITIRFSILRIEQRSALCEGEQRLKNPLTCVEGLPCGQKQIEACGSYKRIEDFLPAERVAVVIPQGFLR
jgi:hypothetical protein